MLSACPNSVTLSLPYTVRETAVLSAWTVLLHGYYNQTQVSFLKFAAGDSGEQKDPETVSISLQRGWNSTNLQDALNQPKGDHPSSVQVTRDDTNRSAVLFSREEGNHGDGDTQTEHLAQRYKVSLCSSELRSLS